MERLPIVFVLALALAAALVPFLRRLARAVGMLDVPKAHKTHREPTPLLGGAAIYLAVNVAMLVTLTKPFQSPRVPSILVGAALLFVLGLWDDRRGLHAGIKLIGQLAASIGIALAGVKVNLFGHQAADMALTVFWVVGITNAMNLMDNMDGLAAGVAAVASGVFVIWAVDNGQYQVAALGTAMLGACLGFLLYNFNPASIFMGDAGSMVVGFVLAALATDVRYEVSARLANWMPPVLILGLPIFDTLLVTVSRLRRGVPIWVGARDHVSHRLVRRGWSVRRTVVTMYFAGAVLGAAAFVAGRVEAGAAAILAVAIALAATTGLFVFERMRTRDGAR